MKKCEIVFFLNPSLDYMEIELDNTNVCLIEYNITMLSNLTLMI